MAHRIIDADDSPEGADAGSDRSPAGGVLEPDAGRPSSGTTEAIGAAEHYAGHLRESASSMFHFAAMAPALKGVDMRAYQIYRDRLLADCGGPTDPIEVMIIEQLSMAHLSLGLLSCKTTNAGSPEAVKVYSGAAARLMGEFRRSALALQAYRAASRQLALAGSKDGLILTGEPVGIDDEFGEGTCAGEEGLPIRENDDERPVIPLQRAASV